VDGEAPSRSNAAMQGRTPVLVGCAQLTDRDGDGSRSPVDLMAETARAAADDAGAGRALLEAVDTVSVVNVIGWPYEDAPGLLCRKLRITPARTEYAWIGGNTPQWLVNRACRAIAGGAAETVLLSGAEAIAGYARALRAGREPAWERGTGGRPTFLGDLRQGSNEHENEHGMTLPSIVYPLFENALRAKAGRTPRDHLAYLGRLCARMTEVAADNPRAWFRDRRTAAEIATASEENRLVSWPYTKYMNAILSVDQSASVLVTSVDRARRLGVDPSRFVFLHGHGEAHDLWHVSERRDYTSSPAIAAIAERAFEMAAIGPDDVDWLDLYSCFPSSVQITRDALGIAEDDPRPLTVTGGLAAHGGPGNAYVMHAIATMMERLRRERGRLGLVTAMGWFVTKHAIGIYGAEPPHRPWTSDEPEALQARLDRLDHPRLEHRPDGRARIETYTVPYERDQQPQAAVVIGRLESGARFLARTPEDRGLLDELVTNEGVGRSGSVTPGNVNTFSPD